MFTAIRTSSSVLFGPVADREGGSHCALRVVPVRGRSPEDPHDRVPDELLDCASKALDLHADTREVRVEVGANVLGVEPFGAGGRADHVHEQNRDDPALLAHMTGRRERRRAGVAELRAVGVLLAAVRTREHGREH